MILQYEELLKRCNVVVDSEYPMAMSKVSGNKSVC